MPFDIVTIGLLHTGEEGNPLVYASRLQKAFPGCNGLSIRRDRWIPVTERLPDEGVRVLVYGGGAVYDARYYAGEWKWQAEVTHWMSLPEPPEVA